jgi:hypothetical protein
MNTYYTKFQKEKKINDTTTRLANVSVYTITGKKIGCETVSKWQKSDDVANMIIRDYETSKVWNSKQFSFNK